MTTETKSTTNRQSQWLDVPCDCEAGGPHGHSCGASINDLRLEDGRGGRRGKRIVCTVCGETITLSRLGSKRGYTRASVAALLS